MASSAVVVGGDGRRCLEPSFIISDAEKLTASRENSAVFGHLDHTGDQIYNAAPRLTLSSRILHASSTTAALVDEWLRR